MEEIFKRISDIGILPVITINDSAKAVPLANALVDGGIPAAEITFRTEAAADAIKYMSSSVPDIAVGAGTIHSVEQVKRAIDAGAKFIVSPGLNPKVVTYCLDHNIPILPGCATPTEIENAMELGLSLLKFFPAHESGGIATLKDMSAPFSDIKFIPTGGINNDTLNGYLSLHNVAACGGSWMAPASLIDAGEFGKITQLCKEAISNMFGFKLLHVGINAESKDEAQNVAGGFSNLFGLTSMEGSSSIFVGTPIEVMKEPFLGTHGHIAFETENIERAVSYFRRRGIAFKEETAVSDNSGLATIYFADEIGGFAVHLRRKL